MNSLLAIHRASVPGRLAPMSLKLEAGMCAGLVGPNGSGKSTLLQIAAGVLDAAGEVEWNGRPLRSIPIPERGRLAAWVPQSAHFEFGFTVRSVVAQGRYAHGDDNFGVEKILEKLDLSALAERPVTRLSGGERERVLLARALVTDAPLQLWDEPLAPLDPHHALEVLAFARECATRAKGAVLFSLHDLALAAELDWLIVLHNGQLRAEGKPADILTPELLREVFRVNAVVKPQLTLELPE